MDYEIVWRGCHDRNYMAGRYGQAIEALVHHRMVGSLVGTDATFATYRADHPVSTQFGVGRWGSEVRVHQYVNLCDTAFGNGNWGAGSDWVKAGRGKTLINSRTVSIEHEDGGTRNRGVVEEDILKASIWLGRLLFSGDVAAVRKAGVAFRCEQHVRDLFEMGVTANSVIDHHYVAGYLKPYCWRPWMDDVGFPKSRYLSELKGVVVPPQEDDVFAYTREISIHPEDRVRVQANKEVVGRDWKPMSGHGTGDVTRKFTSAVDFHVDQIVYIAQEPDAAPEGKFFRAIDGPLAGLLVPASQVTYVPFVAPGDDLEKENEELRDKVEDNARLAARAKRSADAISRTVARITA